MEIVKNKEVKRQVLRHGLEKKNQKKAGRKESTQSRRKRLKSSIAPRRYGVFREERKKLQASNLPSYFQIQQKKTPAKKRNLNSI